MADEDDLEDAIATNAQGPAEVQGDSSRRRQHSLIEQIEADRYLASKRAARAGGLGIRLTKLVPPGTNGC